MNDKANSLPPLSTSTSAPAKTDHLVLGSRLTLLIAVAAGLAVANIYYNQPVLGLLMQTYQVGAADVAAIPFLAQLGYAMGIVFVSPLGDRLERKRLIIGCMLILALTLGSASIAPTFGSMVALSMFVGVAASVTQQLVPMAVTLAEPSRRGRVIGIVTSGILTGVLLARLVSGYVSDRLGWPFMLQLASAAVLACAVLLAVLLPKVQPVTRLPYRSLLGSIAVLVSKHRVLRRSALIQACVFSAFMAFWCNLALVLHESPQHLGSTTAGMYGLIGLAGVLMAPIAGRLADKKGGPRTGVTMGVLVVLIAYAVFLAGGASPVTLGIGAFILDVGLQLSQIGNQTRVYALDPAARSRLNTVFMSAMFLGGAIGTAVSGTLFNQFGWIGVCCYGFASLLIALYLSTTT